MKNIFLPVLTVLAVNTVYAQVSLTSTDAPPVAKQYIMSNIKGPSTPFTFSTSGSTNTWDFTTVTTLASDDDTIAFLDPVITGGSTDFPSATHATLRKPVDKVYTYIKVDATGTYVLGAKGDFTGTGGNIAVQYQTPLTVMTFPYAMNSSVNTSGLLDYKTTGAAIGQSIIDSVWLHVLMISSQQVIAEGNIVLPSGTFPAILERVVTITYDSTMIKGAITSGVWTFAPFKPDTTIDTIYNWYTQASLQPYGRVQLKENTPQEVLYFKAVANDHTGLAETDAASGLSVYPNPATQSLNVFISATHAQLELISITGQRMMQHELVSGTNTISTEGLAKGIYFAKVTDSSGSRTCKIVKE